MNTTRERLVFANQPVLDQADFFMPDGFTRAVNILPSQLVVQTFFQNVVQPWTLVTGVGVTDIQAVSGKIYWNEIPGAPGCYSLRFRPNALGFWRVLVSYAAETQIVALGYDVVAPAVPVDAGLKASFMKQNC